MMKCPVDGLGRQWRIAEDYRGKPLADEQRIDNRKKKIIRLLA